MGSNETNLDNRELARTKLIVSLIYQLLEFASEPTIGMRVPCVTSFNHNNVYETYVHVHAYIEMNPEFVRTQISFCTKSHIKKLLNEFVKANRLSYNNNN